MRQYISGFAVWLLLSITVLAAMAFLSLDVNSHFFYPRSGLGMLAAASCWIALPCSIAAGLSFALAASSKPRVLTLVWTVGSTFMILCGLFAIWLYAIYAADHSYVAQTLPALVPVFLGVAVFLPALSFLCLPLIVSKPSRNIIKGLWWRAFFLVLSLEALFALFSAINGGPLSRLFGDLAKSMGGHYYTWLNVFDPWVITIIAMAGATRVGLYWAKAHDALNTTQE